ncbi:MAG TPA: hypothetical protein VNN18_09540 [Candidatus Xenobia bacterium]|nr:hypothetical protein [Candidatus Xenobia bacterium]
MTTRRFQLTLLAILLAALSLQAGDPWKDKPYTTWTYQEVDRILNNSPWARPIQVAYEERRPELSIETRSERRQEVQGTRVTTTGVDVPVVRNTVRTYTTMITQAVVEWGSAVTARQARLREKQILAGDAPPLDTAAVPPLDYYVIYARGNCLPMSVPPHDLLKLAYLEAKRSKTKIFPMQIERGHSQLGFFFDRQRGGVPTIPPEEEKVRFYLPTPESCPEINVEFDLRKMVRDGKPDL